MSKEDFIELKGKVTDRLSGGKFKVKLYDKKYFKIAAKRLRGEKQCK